MKSIYKSSKKKIQALSAGLVSGAAVLIGQNKASASTLTEPVMPDSSGVFQDMVDTFGTAGSYAIVVIGGGVSLGLITVLAMYVWRLLKKWLSSAK